MSEHTTQIIEFIAREIVRRPEVQISADTELVSSGLVDSLALVDILMKLEKITGCRIPAGEVQAEDMNTVNLMLATVARVGRPQS
jgi:D-alanine--poly(phosphoribitol) ligase subunit 2